MKMSEKLLRALNSIEEGMEILNRGSAPLNFVVILKLNIQLEKRNLKRAIDYLFDHQEACNLHIEDVGGKPYYIFNSDSDRKIEYIVCEDWKTEVQNLINKQIISSNRLIELFLIIDIHQKASYLIGKFHHSIADAISGINLLKHLINTYMEIDKIELENPRKNGEFIKLSNIIDHIQPSLEDLKNVPSVSEEFLVVGESKNIPFRERRCNFLQKNLEITNIEKLRYSCRREKATVHGAICAAMMLTIVDYYSLSKTINLSCRSSIDLRRRLAPNLSPNHLGLMVSGLTTMHKIEKHLDFWELAREVTDKIHAPHKLIEAQKSIFSYSKNAQDILRRPNSTPFSIFVTNVGNISSKENFSENHIDEISYFLSIQPLGSAYAVAVSTFKEKMIFNFVFVEQLIAKETIEKLANKSIEKLEQC